MGGVDQPNLQRILEILDRDPVIDNIVPEIGTGLRARRWATHEDELIGLLDRISAFNQRTAKPFIVIMHSADVEAVGARGGQPAPERGLVAFASWLSAAPHL